MNIEQLNADYGIADQLQFSLGQGDFPIIKINNAHAQAMISVYGGQVLSYRPTSAPEDLMFISEQAYYQTGKAIKGGTPICWPWFGPDPESLGRASHGFVRNRLWTVQSTSTTPSQEIKVKLGLVDTPETRDIWPHSFDLSIEFTIGSTLKIELITHNTGEQPFSITQALHTYFQVGDIAPLRVKGLEGAAYIDKVDGGVQKQQSGEIAIAEEVDRIYLGVSPALAVEDPTLNRRIEITASGSQTAVVWNPWVDNSTKMADLKDDDYQKFVCVETANAANEVIEIQSGTAYSLTADYRIVQL
ncbi:D-hexose-6-phosphate mutarotase [Acaryochloris marina]|uniref:Putative glucose-6-phosphate 1-epimerase n=1 Tax=Acaryochloris marina (strain MBIC 11017) TaxID=329726 RepID=B0C788_ACAM1|nr:D-hexose-6-phosphate mutarotase [Acaryochloris marina]ABW30065.1 aldose 1-epimerase [Acaryochloris marina MBIC11017]BDM78919.1 D-hexose-6-phosphate mutarotase [Acaryochloris marina MBIC10699]